MHVFIAFVVGVVIGGGLGFYFSAKIAAAEAKAAAKFNALAQDVKKL